MDRAAAELEASRHPGALVARVVRDDDGRLVLDLPGGFPQGGLRLLGPKIVEEGRFVVLVPTSAAQSGEG